MAISGMIWPFGFVRSGQEAFRTGIHGDSRRAHSLVRKFLFGQEFDPLPLFNHSVGFWARDRPQRFEVVVAGHPNADAVIVDPQPREFPGLSHREKIFDELIIEVDHLAGARHSNPGLGTIPNQRRGGSPWMSYARIFACGFRL
jgi:hypothetical protein